MIQRTPRTTFISFYLTRLIKKIMSQIITSMLTCLSSELNSIFTSGARVSETEKKKLKIVSNNQKKFYQTE